LDEPTNHLDVESIEALEDALEDYPGTVLLVSHDRALLRELSTRVWAFAEGRLNDFPGPFVDWEEKAAREEELRDAARLEAERAARAEEKARSRREEEERREKEAPLRAARKELQQAEIQVQEAEAAVSELEAVLANPTLYDGSSESAREARRLNVELKKARQILERAMSRWADAIELLDALEGK
jgi:ATP-binding cassette subfamily F protein 3